MEPKVQSDLLRELSRDKKSFEKLKELFKQVIDEKATIERDLQLLESAVRSDYDAILITELNMKKPGPKIIYVNDGFSKMTGYAREEVIGKTPRILQGPKTERAVLDRLKERLSKGQPFFGQAVNYRKDGSEFVNQWDIHPLTDSEGNVTHWVSYQQDITERKRAEKVFINTQTEFDELREEVERTIVDVDFQGNVVMANKSFRELTGFGKDELKQIKIWDFFPRRHRDFIRSRFRLEKEPGTFSDQRFRAVIRHRSGVPIQVRGQTKILDLNNKTLIRVYVKNISLQKRVMEVLQQHKIGYDATFEKASEFTYQLWMTADGEFHFEYVSEEFPEITGLSSEEIKQKGGLRELVHNNDIDKVKKYFQRICKDNSCTCEYRIRNKNGDYVSVIDYGKLQQHDQGTDVMQIKGVVSLKPASYTDSKSRSIH